MPAPGSYRWSALNFSEAQIKRSPPRGLSPAPDDRSIRDPAGPEPEQIRFRPRDLTKEKKMTTPPCPQDPNFSVVTGFLTPGSDTGPGVLDGGISVDVQDPTEG